MSKDISEIGAAREQAISGEVCGECLGYLDRRSHKIAGPLARAAAEQGRTSREVAEDYMNGVHDRHLAGLPI